MPYKIVPFLDGYRLVKLTDPTHIFSYHPMTYENVKKQMRAIETRKHKKGGATIEQIKQQKPSAYRSMQLAKYGYSNPQNKGNLRRWINEEWLNLNALLVGQELPCGKKYKGQTDATVCRPKKAISKSTPSPLAYDLTPEQIKKAIKLKNAGNRINWKKI